jgi:hypothetical protein
MERRGRANPPRDTPCESVSFRFLVSYFPRFSQLRLEDANEKSKERGRRLSLEISR